MSCASGMIKYLVFLFNLVFAIAGLAMLVVGVLYQIELNDTTKAIENSALAVAPTLIIVIGSIIFVISFFGCCGAVKESTCMLTTYAVILLGIFILQIAIGVFAFIQVKDSNGSFQNEIHKALQRTFNRYQQDQGAREAFDLMQQTVHCCGVDGPRDFDTYLPNLPSSCCENNFDKCSMAASSRFDEGCSKKLYRSLKDNIEVVGYVALGLCVTELVAAIFSLCLTSSIRNERRRGGYA